ncbi:hypothetical protein [Nodularia sp. NIES-3585]|nr:hypothetical protein [Nodularia sp. NIES-3585]GAX38871.1 hypothetical protein NIES3585_49230 [Nodularia sp. NIES-3585]
MPTTVKLIRGQNSMTVEADVVELTQKHADDYTGQWKEQMNYPTLRC